MVDPKRLYLSDVLAATQNIDTGESPPTEAQLAITCPSCGVLTTLDTAATFEPRRTVYRCPTDQTQLAVVKYRNDDGVIEFTLESDLRKLR